MGKQEVWTKEMKQLIIFEGTQRAGKTTTANDLFDEGVIGKVLRLSHFSTRIDAYVKSDTYHEDLYIAKILGILGGFMPASMVLDRCMLSDYVFRMNPIQRLWHREMLYDYFNFLHRMFPTMKMFIFIGTYWTYLERHENKGKVLKLKHFIKYKDRYKHYAIDIIANTTLTHKNIVLIDGNLERKKRVEKVIWHLENQ